VCRRRLRFLTTKETNTNRKASNIRAPRQVTGEIVLRLFTPAPIGRETVSEKLKKTDSIDGERGGELKLANVGTNTLVLVRHRKDGVAKKQKKGRSKRGGALRGRTGEEHRPLKRRQ